jgi:hypothetical protein
LLLMCLTIFSYLIAFSSSSFVNTSFYRSKYAKSVTPCIHFIIYINSLCNTWDICLTAKHREGHIFIRIKLGVITELGGGGGDTGLI